VKYNIVELTFDARDKPVSHRILAVVDNESDAGTRAAAFASSHKDATWDRERRCWQARDASNRRVRYVTIASE
jgi:hypothetical protein